MIDFEGVGVDVVVEQDVDDGLVRRALGVVLAVPEAWVVVIHDVSEYPKRDAADWSSSLLRSGGQFARILSIQTERRTVECASALDAIRSSDRIPCLTPPGESSASRFLVPSARRSPSCSLIRLPSRTQCRP